MARLVSPEDRHNAQSGRPHCCRCKVAFLYVHPNEYRPDGSPTAREAWVRVPGKHRNKEAAWDALENMIATRH